MYRHVGRKSTSLRRNTPSRRVAKKDPIANLHETGEILNFLVYLLCALAGTVDAQRPSSFGQSASFFFCRTSLCEYYKQAHQVK